MPRFAFMNPTKRRVMLRTSVGLKSLAAGATSPDEGYEMSATLARYYGKAGVAVQPLDADDLAAAAAEAGKVKLSDLDAEATLKLAETEKIDLGTLDVADADDLATAHRTIAEFRRVYESGTADMLREQAGKMEGMDAEALKGATTKYAIVNLIIATGGVPAAQA